MGVIVFIIGWEESRVTTGTGLKAGITRWLHLEVYISGLFP